MNCEDMGPGVIYPMKLYFLNRNFFDRKIHQFCVFFFQFLWLRVFNNEWNFNPRYNFSINFKTIPPVEHSANRKRIFPWLFHDRRWKRLFWTILNSQVYCTKKYWPLAECVVEPFYIQYISVNNRYIPISLRWEFAHQAEYSLLDTNLDSIKYYFDRRYTVSPLLSPLNSSLLLCVIYCTECPFKSVNPPFKWICRLVQISERKTIIGIHWFLVVERLYRWIIGWQQTNVNISISQMDSA